MSPNQIVLSVIFLSLFCVAAWVKENWDFWKIKKLNKVEPDESLAAYAASWREFNAELDRKIAEMKAMGFEFHPGKPGEPYHHRIVDNRNTKVTYEKGEEWPGINDMSGGQKFEIGTSMDEIVARMRQHGDGRGNTVVNEKGVEIKIPYGEDDGMGNVLAPGALDGSSFIGQKHEKETIVVKDGVMHIPAGSPIIDWTKYKASSTSLPRVFLTAPPSDSAEYRTGAEKDWVNEVNEIPGTFDHSADAAAYAAYGLKNLITYDTGNGESETVEVPLLFQYRNKGARKFLPVSNPLGSTAAFMNRFTVNQIFECDRSNRPYETTFRHKKGGSRG